MSFAIDLATNGQDLKKAYNQVLSSDPQVKWAIFGYKNNSLLVQETGASLAEFCSEFDDTQAQYGICQVDHNDINKIVLVGWVGEGTPQSKRTAFNAHFAAVARHFPGYHVQLTAAEGDELTPQIIASKVASGAGANYQAQARKPKYFQSSTGANEDDWGDAKPLEVKEKPELVQVPSSYAKFKMEPSVMPKASASNFKFDRDGASDAPKKPIDLKSLRESDNESKYASTKVEKIESSYKPVGKVNLKEIHEQERKQAEAQGKEVEQFSSLKDRMNAFKLGVDSAKPQYDTKSNRSTSRPASKPAASVPSAAKETSPWASNSASVSKNTSESKWKKPANVHSAPAPESDSELEAKEEGEDDDDEERTSLSAARAKFLNAGKEAPSNSSSTTPTPKAAPENSFASLTSRFAANKSSIDSPKSETPKVETKAPEPEVPAAREPSPEPETPVSDGSISATVITEYEAEDPDDEISLSAGEVITAIEKLDDFWWSGTNSKGESGLFPQENVKETTVAAVKKASAPPPNLPKREVSPVPPTPKRETSPFPPTPARNLPPLPPKREEAAAPPAAPAEPTPAPAPAAEVEENIVYVITAYEADPGADDEISLVVGEKIIDVDRLDENWWAGKNSKGEHGLFPVENVSETPGAAAPAAANAPTSASTVGQAAGVSAIATTDYDADEDDELGFKAGDVIINIEFPSADWWSGELNGRVGLFPPDFVELQ